jgi:hypothetical protein
MLAVGLGIKDVEAGHRVLFHTLETLITRLRRAHAENRLEWLLAQDESFRLKEKSRAGLLGQGAAEHTAAAAASEVAPTSLSSRLTLGSQSGRHGGLIREPKQSSTRQDPERLIRKNVSQFFVDTN